jgi:hypothetical protein
MMCSRAEEAADLAAREGQERTATDDLFELNLECLTKRKDGLGP